MEQANITDVSITAYNLQADVVCKHMHQTVGSVLQTLVHENLPRNTGNVKDLVDTALYIAQHAMCCSVHTPLGSSHGSLVFNRDMVLIIPLIANWHLITTHREHLVNENLRKANTKHRTFDYVANQKELKKQIKSNTLSARTGGPYTIDQVHLNGTITIPVCKGVTK